MEGGEGAEGGGEEGQRNRGAEGEKVEWVAREDNRHASMTGSGSTRCSANCDTECATTCGCGCGAEKLSNCTETVSHVLRKMIRSWSGCQGQGQGQGQSQVTVRVSMRRERHLKHTERKKE